MDLKIERSRAKNSEYLRSFKRSNFNENDNELLIYRLSKAEKIALVKPYKMNTSYQQLDVQIVFEMLSKVRQWFPTEFRDFNKKGLNILLTDHYCSSDSVISERYKNPDLHLLCKLEENTMILFRNSHLSRQALLSRLERIFIHELAHIKWRKLPLYKRFQYYLAYKADGGFSPSLHTKGNITEDIAARTEEYIKFREEFKDTNQMYFNRFKFIEKWLKL